MSKYKMNQNKNEKKYNNNRKEHKKFNKQPKVVNYTELKVPLYLSANQDIIDEVIDVLSDTKFDKISIPLSTYRSLIDSNVDADDTRIATIGHIRKYDSEESEFTVVIYNNFIGLINSHKHFVIEPQITYNKDKKLGTIIKFNIIPVVYENEEADAYEDSND